MTCLSKPIVSNSNSFSSQVETNRNWLELPPELTSAILMRIGTIDLLINVRKVCKTWRKICSDPTIWRVVDISKFHYLFHRWDLKWDYDAKLEELAKQAIDLSNGKIIEFNVDHFGSDDLLRYICERSSQLKSLRLIACSFIMDDELCKMIEKLPLLEELHICYIPVSKGAIEVVGCCCPELKSFSLNQHSFRSPDNEPDEKALAIAENMHGLRHLQLRGNDMTNDGLLAILENCLHLESLDIRECFNVSPEHDLAMKLSARHIKDLSLPCGFETELMIKDMLESAFEDIDDIDDI